MCHACHCTRHRASIVLGIVPTVAMITVTQCDCSFDHCSTHLVAGNPTILLRSWILGVRIQKGHSKHGSSLLHAVWHIDWEGSESGVSQWLGLESSEGSFTDTSGTWPGRDLKSRTVDHVASPCASPRGFPAAWRSQGSWTSDMVPSFFQSMCPKGTRRKPDSLFDMTSEVGCIY